MAKTAPNGLDGVVGHEHGRSTNYITKKGTPNGENAQFNQMPPGMDLNDQKNSDIRDLPYKLVATPDNFRTA
jgi:hypothetical protein